MLPFHDGDQRDKSMDNYMEAGFLEACSRRGILFSILSLYA